MVFASFFACAVIVGAMMRGIQFADAGNAFVRQVAVGDLGFTGTAGPVSYTHLTLPTKA